MSRPSMRDYYAAINLWYGACFQRFIILSRHKVYIHIRFGLFTSHSKHIYALCAGVVVQGKDGASHEGVCRTGGVCR